MQIYPIVCNNTPQYAKGKTLIFLFFIQHYFFLNAHSSKSTQKLAKEQKNSKISNAAELKGMKLIKKKNAKVLKVIKEYQKCKLKYGKGNGSS